MLMETSPSQLSGQVGGVRWSAQTGHPAVVTDDFHQGGLWVHLGSVREDFCQRQIFIYQQPHSAESGDGEKKEGQG